MEFTLFHPGGGVQRAGERKRAVARATHKNAPHKTRTRAWN